MESGYGEESGGVEWWSVGFAEWSVEIGVVRGWMESRVKRRVEHGVGRMEWWSVEWRVETGECSGEWS